MQRPLLTARLELSHLLSERTQCYHFEFSVEGTERFDFTAGQFVSLVATDGRGKQQTRAYSLASAPDGNRFELCANRVEGGFFSNLLADLRPGETVQFHGPHGLFTLREPLTDSIFIATGTGIAPMRGFIEHLFPDEGPVTDRSAGKNIWLVYGTRQETELYYEKFFERVAAAHPNFRYLSTLSRPHPNWQGLRGYVQDHVAEIASRHAAEHALLHEPSDATPTGPVPAEERKDPHAAFPIYAYICGLNAMVSANRERLQSLGWQRKQIVFERYD